MTELIKKSFPMRLFKGILNFFSRRTAKVLNAFPLPGTLQKPAVSKEIFYRGGKMLRRAGKMVLNV